MRERTIINPVQEFGACVKDILKRKGISASELARMMAYKSRNSIFRILDEAGGHSPRQAFYDRLIGEDPLALDEEDKAALAQALEVSRVGQHAFLSNHAMRELLMDADARESGPKIRVDAFNTPEDPEFKLALREIERCKVAYVTITGCCDRAIFEALRERIYKADVTCEVRVAHIMYTGEEEIVRNISAIQPLLYCDCYRVYCLKPGAFSPEREAMYRHSCIYALMQDEQGNWFRHTLLLVDKGVFAAMQRVKTRKNDRYSRYFAEDIRKMPMLKSELPTGGSVESYLEYTQSCLKMEQARAMYTIKLDPSLACIHPDILLSCVKDEFWQMAADRAEALKAEFWRIHMGRWDNMFSRKKESRMIFSQAAMRSFAATGRLSDHFFAIRTYKPEERAAIIRNLRDQVRNNPLFHVYFFCERFEPMLTEIGLYEGLSTLMTKPYTNYDLASDHTEAIVTEKEFCERYKAFYMNDLLERHVISQEETMALLDELIDIAENAQ
ncbi:MAG: hypothetical protein IKU38_00060 [Clostridia bacterium]|nr:hypothetical protein [Clostridia bacterium]